MENLFKWFADQIVIWAIAGFAGWKFVEAVGEQKIMKAVMSLIIGGFAYYFVKNPTTVLEFIANIFGGKIFGGS